MTHFRKKRHGGKAAAQAPGASKRQACGPPVKAAPGQLGLPGNRGIRRDAEGASRASVMKTTKTARRGQGTPGRAWEGPPLQWGEQSDELM